MSTATFPTNVPGEHPIHEGESYLKSHGSWFSRLMSWIITVDHKRIGVMYLIVILFSLMLGGAMALLMRLELATSGPGVIAWIQSTFFAGSSIVVNPADLYNRVMTLHGAIMVFLFIIPSIPAALGNFFLPIMIGAKDVAFPKLNLASFYVYVLGAIFAVFSMINGAVDTGWTFYTPYSTDPQTQSAVISMTLGAFILGFSSIFTGINFVVTVHKMRAPGMGWFRMPLFVWALYATAIIQILATPVLGITLLLLIFERFAGIGIFDPLMGGDPILYQHFFWFYSHPAVYIMILPGMGIISELISTYSRKPIFGYRFIAFSSIALALIGFLVWGHHMFTSGQSEVAIMIFSALTFLVSIPSAIKVFNWLTTMYRGSIVLTTGMLYALSFIFMFTIGGLTGLFLGTLATDIQLHDTYFIVAHFHYVMMGGTVMAFLGGLHHWWPKMSGRYYPENLARICAALVFFGFNLTFFPQFILGSRGMPRRYYDYPDDAVFGFEFLHLLSTVGALILGLSLVVTVGYLTWAWFKGAPAPANPWGSRTPEWHTASPPTHHNFEGRFTWDHDTYDYGVDPSQATVKH